MNEEKSNRGGQGCIHLSELEAQQLRICSIQQARPSRSCTIRGQLTVWTIEGDFYMSFNKIVIAEFLEVEELKDEKDGAEKYESFVNSYNYEREHGGINGMTPAEKFVKCLKRPILIH